MSDNRKFVAACFITFCDRSVSVELLGKRKVFYNHSQFCDAMRDLQSFGASCFTGDFASCNFQTELINKINLKG
jgi:hypothetical protein